LPKFHDKENVVTTPLDLIIPAYNNLDITFRCVAAIKVFAPREAHTILVDNGSRDTPRDAVHTLKESVESIGGTYLRLDPNRGPYGAVNAGIALAKSDVIGVVCNDVVVLPGTIQAMFALVSPERPYIGATSIPYGEFDYTGYLSTAVLTGMIQLPIARRGFHFSCFLAHRSLYDRVGLYDDQFGLTFGDTDHEQRIADAGITPLCVSSALVYHGHGVGRKRGGIDADLRNDLRDYASFVEKWKDRPDVLERHPREDAEAKRAFLETKGWTVGEQ
jgi:GT2 family glycosyltransferase